MSDSIQQRPFSGRRFWLWYGLAWLDLAGLYTVVFLITSGDSLLAAVTGALTNVMPMALLGIAALAVFRRLDWTADRRARFVLTHVALSLLYGISVTGVHYVMIASIRRMRGESTLFGPEGISVEYFTWETVMGMMIYGVLAGVCYAILLHARMREQEALAARATALKTEAELRALRAQLNPHFLFNTLHTLLGLVRHDARAPPELIARMTS